MSASKLPDDAAAEQTLEDLKRASLAIYECLHAVLAKADAPALPTLVALHLIKAHAIRGVMRGGVSLEDSAKVVALIVTDIESSRGGDA